jgi:hypothetical protein
MICTMGHCLAVQKLDGFDERHIQEVNRQVDGAASTTLRARVVPLGTSRHDLEVAAVSAQVPALALIVLDRPIRRVRLDMGGQQLERVARRHLAKPCQRRGTERSTLAARDHCHNLRQG